MTIALSKWLLTAAMVASSCAPGPDNGRHSDVLLWKGVYYQVPFTSTGRPLTDADLGAVEFRVKAAVPRSRTPLTDRDAAMIPAGEPVFAVNGYKTSFRLAARHDGGLFLYEATPHPAARRGADLIGLERVVGIGLYSDGEGYGPLARIEDRSRVDALVRSIAIAPVDLAPPWGTAGSGGRFVFMAFEFADGTRTVRGYNGGRGALSDVIFPEEAFRTTIDAIMRSTACAPSCWP